MTLETAETAADFNRMSSHVEEYVGRLQEAATANSGCSSARSGAPAAIDAKDPYTRGIRRVATLSRAIARTSASPRSSSSGSGSARSSTTWEDRIEDRAQEGRAHRRGVRGMKRHPTVGADILAPIEPLRDMLPAVRWHHENWNGRGYPDGLRARRCR